MSSVWSSPLRYARSTPGSVIRARGAIEALIRGHRSEGIIAALRGALARAWVPIGLTIVGGLLLFFIFGLSLGLLAYYHASVSTLGVLLVLHGAGAADRARLARQRRRLTAAPPAFIASWR